MVEQRPGQVRVLLVDDHPIVRAGTRFVLEQDTRLRVIGEASRGRDAVYMAGDLLPDLVLMDINLPGIDGLEATRRILAASPGPIAVVALSTETGLATRAVATGAAGFISKADFDPDRLQQAWATTRG